MQSREKLNAYARTYSKTPKAKVYRRTYSKTSKNRAYRKTYVSKYQKLPHVKEARAEEQRRRLAKPDKRLARDLHRLYKKYGLTAEAFYDLIMEERGQCANTGCRARLDDKSTTSKINIDHSHATGKVRSILCINCNSALGLLKENSMIVLGLAAYIEDKCTN